jgi:hypothetical protein
LRDEPPDASGAGGREKNVGALGTQPVGQGEPAIEMPEIRQSAEIRQFVDQHLGVGCAKRPRHRRRVERVSDGGLCTHPHDHVGLGRTTRQSGDLMTPSNEGGNKLATDGACGACNKDPHDPNLHAAATAGR